MLAKGFANASGKRKFSLTLYRGRSRRDCETTCKLTQNSERGGGCTEKNKARASAPLQETTIEQTPEAGAFRSLGLAQDPLYDVAVHVRQPVMSALKLERQLLVVDPQQMQDCGVQVMDMDGVASDVVAEVIGLSDG